MAKKKQTDKFKPIVKKDSVTYPSRVKVISKKKKK